MPNTPASPEQRPYDIVLYGATGFVGELTADYLVKHLPESGKLALAGRNQEKLEALRDRLRSDNPGANKIGIIQANSTDHASLARMAQSTRVVLTTVGPYLKYGLPLVTACAEAGTDYADLTAEPEFVDRAFLNNDATARRTGARIVHSCGFGSIPQDLGALFAAKQLPAGADIVVRDSVKTNGGSSGGAVHSWVNQLARLRQLARVAKKRREREPHPANRRARAATEFPRFNRVLNSWLIPLPTLDRQLVTRSALSFPDASVYGPNFTYSHNIGTKKFLAVAAIPVAAVLAVAALQVPPLRRAVLRKMNPGEGPSKAQRDRAWFAISFEATGGGKTVHTRVSGGDPGYDETAKMLAESGLCLAFDDNPDVAGQLTTATAMGDNLIDRLMAAGIKFEVLGS